jgi:hypothetical protein
VNAGVIPSRPAVHADLLERRLDADRVAQPLDRRRIRVMDDMWQQDGVRASVGGVEVSPFPAGLA